MTAPEPADKDGTIRQLRARAERYRYVLEGVRAAIDTGRNKPLQIWRDQINIALSDATQEPRT